MRDDKRTLRQARHAAKENLRVALDELRAAGSLLHLTQLLVFQTLLHDQRGERHAAFATLEEALTIAQPSRAIRLFADLGSDSDRRLISLLHDLVGDLAGQVDGKSPRYAFAQQLLVALAPSSFPSPQMPPASLAAAPQPKRPPQEFVESLTRRELEILALMEEGMSNKQIAQHLSLAGKTVENHTTNIYQKLDVHNRIQAARRAAELGYLPPR